MEPIYLIDKDFSPSFNQPSQDSLIRNTRDLYADFFTVELEGSTTTSEMRNHQYNLNHRIVFDTESSTDENENSLKLTMRQTFQTWSDAEKFLNEYSLEKGFGIRRKRIESNENKIIRRIS